MEKERFTLNVESFRDMYFSWGKLNSSGQFFISEFLNKPDWEHLTQATDEEIAQAISNFEDEVLKIGKDGLIEHTETFLMEEFLQLYLDDWDGDDDILLINDYDRYFDESEREEFIENNEDYLDWIETDEKRAKEIVRDLYLGRIDEAWGNFEEEMSRKGKITLAR